MEILKKLNPKSSRRVLLASVLGLTALIAVSEITYAQEDDGQAGNFLVIIGAPGAGKSTNSEYLTEKYGIPWVNVTLLLQQEIEQASMAVKKGSTRRPGSRRSNAKSQRNKNIQAAMEKLQAGELIDDDAVNISVASRILQDDMKDGFVLDGYPGSVNQAEFLDALLGVRGIESPTIIYLDVPDEVALERMKGRGRADDKSGFAEERLKQFRDNIGPVIEYYDDDGIYTIDASQDLASVKAEIDAVLNP